MLPSKSPRVGGRVNRPQQQPQSAPRTRPAAPQRPRPNPFTPAGKPWPSAAAAAAAPVRDPPIRLGLVQRLRASGAAPASATSDAAASGRALSPPKRFQRADPSRVSLGWPKR